MARVLAVFTAASVITACGFHLRGAAEIDPVLNPLAIESVSPGSPLLPPLRLALTRAGAVLPSPGSRGDAVLRITADVRTDRVIAVTRQGRPRELELSYRVEFELAGADGVLLEQHALTVRREFAVDERDILGKEQEAETLWAAMLDDMVTAIVRQVVAVRP